MATRIWFFGTVYFLALAFRVFAGEGAGNEVDTKPPVIAQYLFDRKVTNWVEGTVATIGDKQFTLKNTQSFFAAKYAKMLNDINEKTTNFAPAEAARKASEIRKKWRADMSALEPDPVSDKEMNFLLPQQSGGLHVIDESGLYTRDAVSTSGDSRQTSIDSYGKVSQWDDIKAGDRIVVGYHESTENRNALVIIRVTSVAGNFENSTDNRFAEVIELKD